MADQPLALAGDRVDRAGGVGLLGQPVDHRDDPFLVRDRDVGAEELVAAQLADRVGQLDRAAVPELVRASMPSESKAACCIAPDSECATGWPMRTTRLVMLAPLRGRRRSRDRRWRPTRPADRVSPEATSPAIANVIASRWSSRLSVAAPRSRVPPWIRRSSPSTSTRAPRARRPAAMPAIRSDSLWRSSPAPRITVVPSAAAAARQRTGISSIAAATSAGPSSMARSVGRADDAGRPSARRRRRRRPRGHPRSLVDVGAHRPQDVDDRAARRVDADVADGQLGVGMDGARDEPERRRRDVARDPLIHRSHRHPSSTVQATRRPAPSTRSTGTPRARSIRSV